MTRSSVESSLRMDGSALSSLYLSQPFSEEPIRSELFNLDRLEARARELAAALAHLQHARSRPLLPRFAENGRLLHHAHGLIAAAFRKQENVGTDAEWLIDNYHIVDEALREVREDLPSTYYQELPKLADGPFFGLPRAYALALSLIAHTDSCLEEVSLTRFVQAYQTVAPLTIGELWAVPIFLRLGLVENLRRLAQAMLRAWEDRRAAETCARHLRTMLETDGEAGWKAADLAAAQVPRSLGGKCEGKELSDPFLVQLLEILREQGSTAGACVERLEACFAEEGIALHDVLRRENQRQAANQVSVGNCVTSLRLLSVLDWTVFFESTSLVEAVLRDDPAGVYARQDFATRDRYRRAVEQLARGVRRAELEVARRAINHAREAVMAGTASGVAAHHVGYYLVDRGRAELEAALGYRAPPREQLLRLTLAQGRLLYFGGILLLTTLILAVFASYVRTPGWAFAAVLLGLLPACELAVGVVHYLITLFLPPRVLPKLDFKEGIPTDCATFVVMPTMLIRNESAQVLLERLEIHYLSNPDPQLRFGLLTDFADAPQQNMPEDETYLQAALDGVRALNDRYASEGPEKFFVFHRKRQWNPSEGKWMGWERKRGKLEEFNRLLRGDRNTSYTTVSGEPDDLARIRYVITLDADTRMPRETARRLIGTIAHPLNQPQFDVRAGRVVQGYGILQPRVSLRLTATVRSIFSRVFSRSAGIDPYVTAVSDVYQDLFGLGSFTGKGIYHVDAFHAATGNVFPENAILSHDLIEGNFARCGLVTDVELLDDFPVRYQAYAQREHRWVRGDWQLLPWLFGRARPGTPPLPIVERWKMLDNLRRSLMAPALVTFLVLGWTVLPGAPWFWTLAALAVLCLPLILQIVGRLDALLRGKSWVIPLRDLYLELPATAAQVAISACFLVDQARSMLDAITRTLARLFITRRRLLEWETAATVERRLGTRPVHVWMAMWPTTVIAASLAALVLLLRPAALSAAAPFLLAWLASPWIAYWISRPPAPAESPLTADERRALRRVARKTWSFFETFVGEEDHWLPPDNYQEDPKGQVAHRTSPTNQGLLLVSTLAAHDFGYLSLPVLLDRIEKTLATFDQLERFQGHFYNWYDTRTLHPLQPIYVSTVDSGNLLACLIALKNGLREKAEEMIPGPAWREGITDTLRLVQEALETLEPKRLPKVDDAFPEMTASVRAMEHELRTIPGDLPAWSTWLDMLEKRAETMIQHARRFAELLEDAPDDLLRWSDRLHEQLHSRRQEFDAIFPWVSQTERDVLHPALSRSARGLELRSALDAPASVAEVHERQASILDDLRAMEAEDGTHPWQTLADAVRSSAAGELLERCQKLADRADEFARAMDFKLLYNDRRNLFSIGYNHSTGRLDQSHYDLLASEACLTSFLAVARGDADKKHWFQLGRPLTQTAGEVALVSWGGTMFEYLMPRIFLRIYPGTLIEQSHRGAVGRQIEYGRHSGVPWGISESGFGALDGALDYQYQSFGVPGLGLKRGLARDLVVAPYATALALMVQPRAALKNLRALTEANGEGPYGYYEAIDFTRDRQQAPRGAMVVRSYMAHHQGMSMAALANCLLDNPMPRRVHAEPMVRATELLLQERMPRLPPLVRPHADEAAPPHATSVLLGMMSRRLNTPHTPAPRTHLLSNGRFTTMVTNAGAGYCTFQGLAVTRWREDRTRDGWGPFLYFHDLRSGLVWSAGHQPVGRTADEYEVIYSADKAQFRRIDAGIETITEIAVSPEHAAEVRKVTLTNHNRRPHEIEVTSYAEIVLGPHAADLAHPAFNKLFLETEFLSTQDAILCRRRPRAQDQAPIWGVHVLAVEGSTVGGVQFETDRARFLGRCRGPANPAALDPDAVLTGTTGPVLDPIFSLRRRVRVRPGASVTLGFTTAVATSRDEALAVAGQYHDVRALNRAFELAYAHSQVELRHLHLTAEVAHLYLRLASFVIYAGQDLRAPAEVLAANHQGQPALWRHGLSGDLPILLVRISEAEQIGLVRHLLAAHTFWRLRGLVVDLVILNEHPAGYFEELHQEVMNLLRSSDAHNLIDKPGGVFVRKASHIPDEDRILLQSVARVVLRGGSLASQIDRLEKPRSLPPRLVGRGDAEDGRSRAKTPTPTPPEQLAFFNGFGGFTPDGREYVVTGLATNRPTPATAARFERTPAPWINVIANPACGFLVSESGAGYTWAGNSQQNRLTPWNNDPVTDPPGEMLFLRDEASGEVWRVPGGRDTAATRGAGTTDVRCRHGQGYSIFEQSGHGLHQEVLLFVPVDDPVKIMRLRVRNEGKKPRRLSATFYAEWVLGTTRDQSAMHVTTEVDAESGTLLARNAFNPDFASGRAFADVSLRPRTLTADRGEFLGRNAPLDGVPAALTRTELSGKTGAGLDPCAALQVKFEVAAGEEKEVVFFLGQGRNADVVRAVLGRYRDADAVRAAFHAVRRQWDDILGAVQVRTPDPALDVLVNRWLLYQGLSCRIWGRSAFYQSGGAFGFRDQLQDVMALVYGAPGEARAHILRAAARQFLEGDVQHWWHPPAGRGVRTRFSDDFLWLPFVVHHYLVTTGDATVLDEAVPLVRAPLLKPDQEEVFGLPEVTQETATLYEHCVLSIANGLKFGAHGLPLMGIGDWNDGMNRVGAHGQGETVWGAWFLLAILGKFADVAEARGDGNRAAGFREQAERLRLAVEANAWDGRWYRRAYFDDGTPLGSAESDDCKIDSIAQTWAAIAGVADPERVRLALESADQQLVDRQNKLLLLFTPPFDQGEKHPGYIKGYVPGIRENGGQYTHASTWMVQAAALTGRGARAVEYFNLLNPIHHASTPDLVRRYKVEPYVVAADVYSQPPHTGRGGWTWYTGSAGWLYRVALESILGFHLRGDRLLIDPRIDRSWPRFEITYRHRSATYHITVENPEGVESGVKHLKVDGTATNEGIPLVDDGRVHEVVVVMG